MLLRNKETQITGIFTVAFPFIIFYKKHLQMPLENKEYSLNLHMFILHVYKLKVN